MNEYIKLRISKEDKRLLTNEAKKHRLSISAYVRTKMLNDKPIDTYR
jgi:predicted HicB family RNase H-like nuclease